MYKLFAMNSLGQLYHVGLSGWIKWTPRGGVYFISVDEVRDYLFRHYIGELPDTVDCYIAEVDRNGMILATFSPWEECNESNDSNK